MSIAYEINLSKYNIGSFSELIPAVMEQAMKIGLEILKRILEERDAEILARRDKARFRCKGLQKTSVKTSMGILDLTRRVYVDTSVTEGVHCVCLLDKEMKIEKIGLTEKALCERAAALACVTSYRNAAEILTAHFAVSMSAMGVWNIVQALENKESQRVERYAELAEQSAGTGTLAAPVLYEENDGVWLKLQGEDRKKYGEDKEMKVGIAYDGVTWDAAKTRKELHNKVAYASFEDAKSFGKHKEGMVSHCFDAETVKLRVINGDGAQWIQKNNPKNCLSVLDAYHRNRALGRFVKNPELAGQLRQLLYAGEISALLERLETARNETTDEQEKESLSELLGYYTANKDALTRYYERGVEIPPTSQPGIVHHARLGSMESNIFTIIGNRMKGRRACWSVRGGNHLALLLCRRNSVCAEDFFTEPPTLPKDEPQEPQDTGTPLSAAKIPETLGKGSECYCHATLPDEVWLKRVTAYRSFVDLKF